VFVENKIDLVESSVLDVRHVERLAKQHKFRLYRCSATHDFNVNDSFTYLVQKAIKLFPDPQQMTPIQLESSQTSVKSGIDDTPDADTHDVMHPSKRRTHGRKSRFMKLKVKTDDKCSIM
jgi:hypothetical protein